MDVSVVRAEIKSWERQFRKQHARDPTVQEIKDHPAIGESLPVCLSRKHCSSCLFSLSYSGEIQALQKTLKAGYCHSSRSPLYSSQGAPTPAFHVLHPISASCSEDRGASAYFQPFLAGKEQRKVQGVTFCASVLPGLTVFFPCKPLCHAK